MRSLPLVAVVLAACTGPSLTEAVPIDREANAPPGGTPAPADTVAAGEGGVLGIRTVGGVRTLWVDRTGLQELGTGVAVHRDEGWWRLELRTRTLGSYSDTTVRAWPASDTTRAVEALDPDQARCEGSDGVELLFVTPDYVGVDASGGAYCEGAAHPYAYEQLRTNRIDALQAWPPVGIDVLGPAASGALQKAGAAAGGEDDCLSEPDPKGWALVRAQGRWIARGGLTHLAEVCRGTFKAYTVPIEVPASVTGSGPLPRSWADYQAAWPGLLDVVASPSKALEVVVRKQGLQLVVDGKPGPELAMPGAALVMAQWTTKDAAAWRDRASEVLR